MAKDLLDMDRLPTMEELKDFFKKNDWTSAKMSDPAKRTDEERAEIAYVAKLRHFVEGIARLICSRKEDIANNKTGTDKAIKLVKSRADLLFLRRFHQCLQVSAAHSTVDLDAAMRLMHRYWDYLQDCKSYLKNPSRLAWIFY